MKTVKYELKKETGVNGTFYFVYKDDVCIIGSCRMTREKADEVFEQIITGKYQEIEVVKSIEITE